MPDCDAPIAAQARITGITLTYACPACDVEVDSFIEAEENVGGFAVQLEDRFDLCSHCGQLLDFGASLTQAGSR